MKNIKGKYVVKDIVMFLLISLILALFLQINILPSKNKLYSNLEFNSVSSKMNIINYTVKDNIFIAKNNDPQLLFTGIDSNVSAIEVDFSKPISENIHIQVYFSKNGEELSEQNSILYQGKKGKKQVIIEIPYNNYSEIRVDIGSISGQSFELEDIKICKSQITIFEKIISKIHISMILLLALIFFTLVCLIKQYKSKILDPKNKILEITFLIFCFTMFTLWAIVQPFNSCPDEYMRYDVIKYIFDYNKLPHGGNLLIIDKNWGFSYAFLPYLSGLVSVVFMKIVSIFTLNEQVLILAARMAVVCFGTITVYYVIKIANKCFKGEYKWLFTILVSCLPQFVFLGSYMNNDMLALMSVAMMIYYWLEGHEKNWDIKSNIRLAISVAICLLSYYNAYPFILFSIVFFIWSNINKNIDKYVIFKKFMFVFMIVFILAGWWFIRNGIIYNGDFLGLHTMKQYSNMYAIESLKIINRSTPLKQGVSLLFMLVQFGWLKSTYLSFMGCFGYMNIPLHEWMYNFYTFIFIVGIIGFMIKLLNCKKDKSNNYIFYLCITLSGIITILLSVYNSYTADFQPQGRYIISCIIPLMMFITQGFEYIFEFMKKRVKLNNKKWILIICICCILINLLCFTKIIIVTYT